ncbi:hypothetical protein V8C40DRAFT_229998, partial [Trichoderma camerunense]
MWLAATRPMRGRGGCWLAGCIASSLGCLLALLRPPGQPRLPDDLAFASLPANKGRFALHIIAPGLTLQRGYSQM